ncbi:MAG: serine hydrolase family protein, partial [Calditrichaeota bacterium]
MSINCNGKWALEFMSANRIQVFMVPGYTGSGPGHWQSLWEARHPEYHRVEQKDWFHPHLEEWVERVALAVKGIPGPAVAVGHSLGCITLIHYLSRYPEAPLCGLLLVAPADVERESAPEPVKGFAP